MIVNKRGKLGLIHVAKKQCGLDETAYRALLGGAAGIDSAREIEHEDQFRAVMDAFAALGFESWKSQGTASSRPVWNGQWGCSAAKQAKIEVMWKQVARTPNGRALRAFIARIAKVDDPRFLNDTLARKIILALGAMMRRAGLDPATGERLKKSEAHDG